MPRIRYKKRRFRRETKALIQTCVEILEEFEEQGFRLTLRQLYYQLVGRDLIPNTEQSYDRIGATVSNAREAGLIDWNMIEDRTRSTHARPHWSDGEEFLESVAGQFATDLWEGQSTRCEVWVEKEALVQVVAKAATPFDVPYFANKGYCSSSAMWEAAHNRFLIPFQEEGYCERFVILHLGDHDPSGIDMTRDIQERIDMFTAPYEDNMRAPRVDVVRIALNMDQIQTYQPPPNPAKQTDSRFESYYEEYGDESWELDALPPAVIVDLIRKNISALLDQELFDQRQSFETDVRQQLYNISLG